jgi:hypothetical protein
VRSLSPEISRCRQKRDRGLWPLQTFSRQEVLVLTETGSTLARTGSNAETLARPRPNRTGLCQVQSSPAQGKPESSAGHRPQPSLRRAVWPIACPSLFGSGNSAGKSFARPETAAAFLAIPADFGRPRPRYPGSPLCAQYDARCKIEQNRICHDQPPPASPAHLTSSESSSPRIGKSGPR